jgi:hypothetical protein
MVGLQTTSAEPQTPSPDLGSPFAALEGPPVALPSPLAGMETSFAD